MPCYQAADFPSAASLSGRAVYKTKSECDQACKDGACCETAGGVTTCSVKPQCQCQGTGKTFQGIGTTCSPNPCYCPNAPEGIGRCCGPETVMPVGVPQTYIKCVDGKTKSQCDDIGGVWQERACCDIVGDANVPALVCAGNPLP